MPEMKTVSAREVIADIRVGLTDEQLMAKHQLSVKGLQSLKNKLLAAGLLTQVELDANTSPGKAATPPVDKKAFARNIAEAVKTGMSDAEIMKKFGIPAAKLPGVFASLVKAGYLAQEDLDRRVEGYEQTVELGAETPVSKGEGQIQKEHYESAQGRIILASLMTGLGLAAFQKTFGVGLLILVITALASFFIYFKYIIMPGRSVKYATWTGAILLCLGIMALIHGHPANLNKSGDSASMAKGTSNKIVNPSGRVITSTFGCNPYSIEENIDLRHGPHITLLWQIWETATQDKNIDGIKMLLEFPGWKDKYGKPLDAEIAAQKPFIEINKDDLDEARKYANAQAYSSSGTTKYSKAWGIAILFYGTFGELRKKFKEKGLIN